jgi:hypothetical protein
MALRLQRRSAFGWPASAAGTANPTLGMAVHYEGSDTGIANFSHAECIDHWQDTRRFHMNTRGWFDIGYSFGVCPHYVLEGRGKDKAQAAQPGGNTTWYSCTFMTGPGEQPHPGQVENFRALRAWLMADDVAAAIRPHSSFVATGCPGDVLRAMISDGTIIRTPTPTPKPEPQEDPDMLEISTADRGDGQGVAVREALNDWLRAWNRVKDALAEPASTWELLPLPDTVDSTVVARVEYVCRNARAKSIPDGGLKGVSFAHLDLVAMDYARMVELANRIHDGSHHEMMAMMQAQVDRLLAAEPEPTEPTPTS